jgi:hypothetical protein
MLLKTMPEALCARRATSALLIHGSPPMQLPRIAKKFKASLAPSPP